MNFRSETRFYFDGLLLHFYMKLIFILLETICKIIPDWNRIFTSLWWFYRDSTTKTSRHSKSIMFIGDKDNSIIPNLLGLLKIERAKNKAWSDLIWIDRDCNKEITINGELWICRENFKYILKTERVHHNY